MFDEASRDKGKLRSACARPADEVSGNTSQFMINYRVDNLDALLAQLRTEGVTVEDRVEDYDYGRFGWIINPEGNRIELWEPR
jgi:predicted enzyme related to lactoylglutathione lyase